MTNNGSTEPTTATVLSARHLETERFVLRALTQDDASETYLSWLKDAEINRNLVTNGDEQSIETLRRYIASHDGETSVLFGIFLRDGRHIGNHSFRHVRAENYATVGVMIGDKEYWGQGVPLETRGRILDLAFDDLACRSVRAGCYSHNLSAIYNFKRQGWKLTGKQEHIVQVDDRWSDLLRFEIQAEDWDRKRRNTR